MKRFLSSFVLLLLVTVNNYCFGLKLTSDELVNTNHLDHLYQEINVNGKTMGIIHIYSEYPDYNWVKDEDEGIACVDDAARAAILYLKYYKMYSDTLNLVKAKNLIEFVLYMQQENSYFCNFIWQDYSINKTYKTSVAEPNWWTWRAVWALTEAYNVFKNSNGELAEKLKVALNRSYNKIKLYLSEPKKIKNLDGFNRPTWLPFEFASDQASVLVIALSSYYKEFGNPDVLDIINNLCDGILLMQEGDKNNFPFYAILSWENSWHAWGNSQSYALLTAYQITKRQKYLKAALNEINYFYNYLLNSKYVNEFSLYKKGKKTKLKETKKFSQIAYGIRPMIFACIEAANVTKQKQYSELAGKLALWLFGDNPAKLAMYSAENGICFDGIISEKEVNKNSGAESTIEALLSLSVIEKDKIAKRIIQDYLKEKIR
ncbi:MAG: hypothetical protein NTX22_12100 [Ignavibacteriales bacterium]|nr:hypothetical protein [Ignavibacteriales bacterium]